MKKMILLLTLLTLVAFVSGALAQTKPTPAPAPAPAAPAKEVKIEKFTGAVEKVDEMAKAIVVKDKKGEKTFSIDDKTKITKGEKDMPLAELKKGTNVSVEYKKDGEKLVAVAIKAAAPKPTAKK
jgi:Cu/Ag efflux protein CusF